MENMYAGRQGSLGTFLVKWFLAVMFFIFVCEQIIMLCFQYMLNPLLNRILLISEIEVQHLTALEIAELLLTPLLSFLTDFIPADLAQALQNFLGASSDIRIQPPDFVAAYGSYMTHLYYITILVIFLLAILVYASPYIAGIWWYVRCISRKMNELHEQDMKKQEEYERRRNLLFSDITHDIKTPITTIAGYSRALADGIIQDPDKEREYLNTMYAKSLRVSELITMLFEYVKLDSEGFQLHRESCDLAELVRENVIMLLMDFEEKGIELDIDIPEESCPCLADKIQMSRVVTNLLTNAIRYIADGHRVQIFMKRIADNGQAFYQISVADDGLAIDADFAKHIFDPFSRSDAARQTTSGGSGLGLSIAHKVAQMHGGDLRLNLTYGQGYQKAFQLTVPVPEEP